jgi:DNA-binding MarR family transcriptional regulator
MTWLVMRVVGSDLRKSEWCFAPTHFRILGMLTRRQRTLTDLAEAQGVSLPTMSNTITTLEERGLVRRTRSSEDRRQVVVEITPSGKTALDETRAQAENHLAALLAPLTDADHRRIVEALAVVRQTLASVYETEPTRSSHEG